jgi:hypothetical protein
LGVGRELTESELLCENCGYDIGGIAAGMNCPECGKPVASSFPERRAGSAWQERRGLWSWMLTNYEMLRRPRRVFDRMRMDDKGYLGLLGLNLGMAGLMLTVPWVGTLMGDPARNARGASTAIRVFAYARSMLVGTLSVGMLLFLLTFVEVMGIRFFGRRRGWRITRNVAWQICAHASIGWVLAAVLTLLSLVVWLNVSYFGLSGWLERAGSTGDYVMAAVPATGFFAGMFVFELLVYVGMRRCRFANAPRRRAS